jgi:hypothetical protein
MPNSERIQPTVKQRTVLDNPAVLFGMINAFNFFYKDSMCPKKP